MSKLNPIKCRNNCDTEIYFDPNIKSINGKSIPLEVDTDQPHDCPNKNSDDYEFIGKSVMDLEKKESERFPRY